MFTGVRYCASACYIGGMKVDWAAVLRSLWPPAYDDRASDEAWDDLQSDIRAFTANMVEEANISFDAYMSLVGAIKTVINKIPAEQAGTLTRAVQESAATILARRRALVTTLTTSS